MANINTPKSFEKSLLQGELLKQIEPFVDYVNQNFDQLIRALFNQLTFGENVRGQFSTVSAKHGVPITIDVTEGVGGIMPFRVSGGSLRSYYLTTGKNGAPTVTFFFDDAIPVQTRTVVEDVEFCTTECSSVVRPGDRVLITGCTNVNNNGVFLVIETNDSGIVYRNSSGVDETNTQFRGDRESSKTIDIFVFFS